MSRVQYVAARKRWEGYPGRLNEEKGKPVVSLRNMVESNPGGLSMHLKKSCGQPSAMPGEPRDHNTGLPGSGDKRLQSTSPRNSLPDNSLTHSTQLLHSPSLLHPSLLQILHQEKTHPINQCTGNVQEMWISRLHGIFTYLSMSILMFRWLVLVTIQPSNQRQIANHKESNAMKKTK